MVDNKIIYDKVQAFINIHPEYIIYEEKSLLNVLEAQNVLTTEELEFLTSNTSIFAGQLKDNEHVNYAEILGFTRADEQEKILSNMEILKDSMDNTVVEDLIKVSNPLVSRKIFKEKVLNNINYENANDILNDYETQTGKNLYNVIKHDPILDNITKTELLTYLKKVSPKLLSKALVEDVYGIGDKNLKSDIGLLNKDNIQEVLYWYKIQAIKKDKNFERLFRINSDRTILPPQFIKFFCGEMGDGIINAISNEWSLSKKEKDVLIDYIVNLVVESIDSNQKVYAQDIKRDILNHRKDLNMLDIDIIRYSNRNYGFAIPEIINPPNGFIDKEYCQYGCGDCWLISGLTSIIANEKGKKYIENLLEYNSEKDCVEVELPGVNKKYQIESELIKNCNHLASGDGDIRAIELAVETYLKELAYENKTTLFSDGKSVDIDGNNLTVLYDILLGNSKRLNPDVQPFDLEKCAYTVSLNKYKFAGNNQDKESMKQLVIEHAYSLLKLDEEFLYLYNPSKNINIENIDETQFIKIPIEDSKFLNFYGGELPLKE